MEIEIQEGTNLDVINQKVLPISDALVRLIPQSLYRYRACDKRQIDAFEKDRIYAVTADLFNDPYDTLVRYDINSIKEYQCITDNEHLEWIEAVSETGEWFSRNDKIFFSRRKVGGNKGTDSRL